MALHRSNSISYLCDNYQNYHSLQLKNHLRRRRESPVVGNNEGSPLPSSWIEQTFKKYECIKYIPDPLSDRCGCGRLSSHHTQLALSRFTLSMVKPVHPGKQKWKIKEHTLAQPTDAYGTIEFQGGMHPHKAQYVRLSFDSNPADVFHLMEKVWKLKRPRLVITIHGGSANFDMPDRLGQLFREGLLKAAETTGAWIITSGMDRGVVRHVAKALDEAGISARMRSRLVTIGIAPWGVLRKREMFTGKDAHVQYDRLCLFKSKGKYSALNDRHTYFLLADNGTVGRAGADIFLRKRLEEYLAKNGTFGTIRARKIPILCVALEGGINTLNSIHQYLTSNPPIPTIICEGSGRISNLLAFTYSNIKDDGNLSLECQEKLLEGVKELIGDDNKIVEEVREKILSCARLKGLITVFRMNENDHMDADQTILKALLKGQNLCPAEQLSLTLVWNRVDIARSEVFTEDQDWQIKHLHNVLMDALILNRVEFVKLLLEKGVSIKKFLNIDTLEQLYNSDPTALNTLSHLIDDNSTSGSDKIAIPDIADIIEKLMGNAFRCHYSTRAFKQLYERCRGRKHMSKIESLHFKLMPSKSMDSLLAPQRKDEQQSEAEDHFEHPFNDLFLWAVLTRRHEMARCLWLYGEHGMAKALMAIRLYKTMSREVACDYTEVEASNQLREFADDFKDCSLELLNHCHEQDDVKTMRLLTAELPSWGHHTCLSLAVMANNKRFLAHPCCQILLADLWHGGLRFRSQSNIKVIVAVVFPPAILLLDFKTPEQKKNQRKNSLITTEEELNDYKHDSKTSLHNLHKGSWYNKFRKNSSNGHGRTQSKRGSNDIILNENTNFLANRETRALTVIEENRKDSVFIRRERSLRRTLSSAWSKFELFYGAPITSFWIWTLSFCLFLLTFCYVLLIEFAAKVTYTEWGLFAYVVGLTMEHFRKLLVLESSNLIEKVKVFYTRYWNILTTIGVITFMIGFYFRFDADRIHTLSRVILASNSVIWHMKLFDFLSVHPRLGPYITMAGKMVLAMSYIIIMLLVTLMAFGVARQSITFPHEKWGWILVRNIFYKPYFMLYGEVYAGEIDTCGDEGTNCVPGGWIPPVLMTIFLLVANILLINMLIAIFNNIFNVTNAMSQQVWMFQRYQQVLEYESTPIIPPPFTPFVHIWLLCKYVKRKICGTKATYQAYNNNAEFSIKVYFDEADLKHLHDFEEDCLDDLSRRKFNCALLSHKHLQSSLELSNKLNELSEENVVLKTKMEKLSRNLEHIVNYQNKLLKVIEGDKSEDKGIIVRHGKYFLQ
uniref:LSDAT_euk domain-containing protein n=1 Tax=Bursaphelenchus xylophilus TaxID=6326 RepID=A0A1I7RLF9_BURXY